MQGMKRGKFGPEGEEGYYNPWAMKDKSALQTHRRGISLETEKKADTIE